MTDDSSHPFLVNPHFVGRRRRRVSRVCCQEGAAAFGHRAGTLHAKLIRLVVRWQAEGYAVPERASPRPLRPQRRARPLTVPEEFFLGLQIRFVRPDEDVSNTRRGVTPGLPFGQHLTHLGSLVSPNPTARYPKEHHQYGRQLVSRAIHGRTSLGRGVPWKRTPADTSSVPPPGSRSPNRI